MRGSTPLRGTRAPIERSGPFAFGRGANLFAKADKCKRLSDVVAGGPLGKTLAVVWGAAKILPYAVHVSYELKSLPK